MVRPVQDPRPPPYETEEDAVHRIFVEEVLKIQPSEQMNEEERRHFRIQVWKDFDRREKLQKDFEQRDQ